MITVIATTIAIAVLTSLSWSKLLPDWIEDVPGKTKGWRTALLIGAGLGIGTAGVLVGFFNTIEPFDFRVYPIALLVWLLPLVCLTDFSLYKIPAKVTTATIIALIPNLIALGIHDWQAAVISIGLLIIPALLFFFVMGIGMGDIKLIVMFALGMGWMTYKDWGIALLIMCAFSLLGAVGMLIVGKKLKKQDHEKNLISQFIDEAKAEKDAEALAKAEALVSEQNSPEPVEIVETDEERELREADERINAYFNKLENSIQKEKEKAEGKENAAKKKRKKYATPAGPGFILGWIVVAIWFIVEYGTYIPENWWTLVP